MYPVAEDLRYKLFRIFCMLADLQLNNDKNHQCQVLLHASEAAHIFQQLMTGMGLDCDTDRTHNYLLHSNRSLTFAEFLDLFEFTEYKSALAERTESLNEAIEESYQLYINDIIKKGHLLRRGYLLPTLKEYWFVLQPCELTYYKSANQKEVCGTITLDPFCMVRPSTTGSTGKHEKQLKFALASGERHYELAARDHRSRLQWIAALQLAITYSMGKDGYQRDLAARRRKRREIEHKRKQEEDLLRSIQMREAETAKSQLEQEKLARMAAETQARQLKIVAMEDSRRVAELEDVKCTLEKLLSEETQAKRDEEIVRALQARVLAEEWEKREELELLQEEQRMILEQEREKRKEFELMQKEKEQHLRDAETKLKALEEERQRLDLELKQARFKILHSEESKEMLEQRLHVLGPSSPPPPTPVKDDRIRRALSFMHSNRERPMLMSLDVRATASMLRRSKNKSPVVVQQIAKNEGL